jgi:hypothetical protein
MKFLYKIVNLFYKKQLIILNKKIKNNKEFQKIKNVQN